MKKVEVNEVVQITGAFGGPLVLLNVEIDLSFDIPPGQFSPGMSMIVEQQLHHAVTRMIEKAKKVK